MTDLTLTTPIQAHGTTMTTLSFKEPTGNDYVEAGVPIKEGGRIDTKVVADYISRLAGIPMSAVKSISFKDLMKAQNIVLGFFADTETTDI